ncbi:MAG: glycosyltransferase [Phycisphaerales bacterium]
MIGYVLPTRDRREELERTLEAIGRLPAHRDRVPAEVVIVDNASVNPVRAPNWLDNGVAVRVVRLEHNAGAAARNVGVLATQARVEWVVMLDDDSHPIDGRFVAGLDEHPSDVAALTADIYLPDGSRERGGLPEVPIGCGVAVRRWAFIAAGGYDASFGYYAEEYDLAAKVIRAGRRVVFDPRFRVVHRKVPGGRDMGVILGRLVRNNGWVMQRYAPDAELGERLEENERRYGAIARKEGTVEGYERGVAELRETIGSQKRTPMGDGEWARFTGLAAAREALAAAHRERRFASAAIVERGKNDWAVERALRELGVEVVGSGADVRVIGTMSPGPMLDAAGRVPDAITPWVMAGADRGERAAA